MKYFLPILALAFFFLAPTTYAAVAYDTSAIGIAASGTTINITITVGNNSNRALTMTFLTSATIHVSTVAYTAGSGGTWALVTGTKTNGGARESETWVSTAPSTGSVTVQVTTTGTISDASASLHSFYGVDQTTPTSGGTSSSLGQSSIGVATQSDSMAVYGIVSNNGYLVFTGAATVADTQNVFSDWQQTAHGTGNGGTLTLNWTPANSSRSISACNVRAAAAVSGFPASRGRLILFVGGLLLVPPGGRTLLF